MYVRPIWQWVLHVLESLGLLKACRAGEQHRIVPEGRHSGEPPANEWHMNALICHVFASVQETSSDRHVVHHHSCSMTPPAQGLHCTVPAIQCRPKPRQSHAYGRPNAASAPTPCEIMRPHNTCEGRGSILRLTGLCSRQSHDQPLEAKTFPEPVPGFRASVSMQNWVMGLSERQAP